MSQSSSSAPSSAAREVLARRGAGPAVDAQLDAVVLQRPQRARQERARGVDVHEQRLRGVADARPLRLRVHDDALGRVEVGARVDVDVAVARRRVDHRDGRDALERVLQALAAARDDEVDDAVLGRELRELLATAAGNEDDRALGDAGALGGVGGDGREHGVGVRRRRRAAQHDRVARLQAQRRGVDRDVGPGLVDDRDHAERHAHLADVEAVGQPEAVDDLADRVGERGDRAHPRGDPGDARLVEREAVEERRRQPALAPGLHVARVGLEDLRGPGLERVRDRVEGGVLGRAVERREHPRGVLRGATEIGDGLGGDGHGERVGGPGKRPAAARLRDASRQSERRFASQLRSRLSMSAGL